MVEQIDGSLLPIQVCYDMDNMDTRKKAFAGITEACKFLNVKSGIILTQSNAKNVVINDVKIKVLPAARYFLVS